MTYGWLSIIISLSTFVLAALPGEATAAGLVPCTGRECGTCQLVVLGNSIITFLIAIMTVISAILFAWAGFLITSSAGNSAQVKRGKDIFFNVLVGLIIMLSAWLIIDTVMKIFLPDGNTEFGPWNQIGAENCTFMADVSDIDPTQLGDSWQDLEVDYREIGEGETPEGYFDFLLYERSGSGDDECKIRWADVRPSLEECLSAFNAARNGASGVTSIVDSCVDGTIVSPADWVQTLPDCGGTSGGSAAQCNDDASLRAAYNGSPRNTNAPELNTLISCYRNSAAVQALLDTNQIYTYERSNPVCGPTNGSPVCGACAHTIGSCHYGAGTGRGAMAVDFNSTGNEEALYNALRARQGQCGGTILFEGNHTHISTDSCPAN